MSMLRNPLQGRVTARCAALLLAAAGLAGFAVPAAAAGLAVEEGVVVKFGADAGMTVHNELKVDRHVVFTSVADDDAGGRTGTTAGTPAPGDWRGLTVEPTVTAARLKLDGLALRYAGGSGAAALDIVGDYALRALQITDSLIGVRVGGGASPTLEEFVLRDNGIGVQSDGATPTITASEIAGNAQYGAFNVTTPDVVVATGNWWGAASGPLDAQNNPGGAGDRVSAGVDYGQFRSEAPLIGCAVTVADGNYVRTLAPVTVALECRNAVQYRLAPTNDFGGATYAAMSATATFTLTGAAGQKQIYAEFRSNGGATRVVSLPQSIDYQPNAPTVAITNPAAGAVVTADVAFTADATDAAGIARVEFFVGATSIGTDTQAPYAATLHPASFTAGDYVIKAVATNVDDVSAQATRTVHIGGGPVDTTPPSIGDVRFAGTPLSSGTTTVTAPGTLDFGATDDGTVASAALRIDGAVVPGALFDGAQYSVFLTFAAIANGAHTFEVRATDAGGNTTTRQYAVDVALPPPPAPEILTPVDGNVAQAQVAVSGTAQPGSKVQIYLNGSATGPLLDVGTSGAFGASVTLPSEGGYALHADARNSRGTSAASPNVLINYAVPGPTVLITAPAQDAILAEDTNIDVAVIDPEGVSSVAFKVDGATQQTLNAAPYTWRWPLANVANGSHTIAVVATNVAGKSTTATRDVVVQKTPPPPPPVQTAYTGLVSSVTPATSYGEQDVVVLGRSIDRATNAPLPNSLLRLVLKVVGFERRINVVTDAQGDFRFVFKPQASDAGTYGISANHPDEPVKSAEKQFTIVRLKVSPTDTRLSAARTVNTPVRFTVSAVGGAAINGFRFAVEPEDQVSGTGLPPGISVVTAPAQNIPANGSVPVEARVLADNTAGATGTIVLTAYAADSGTAKRAKVRINYSLTEPFPNLVPTPTSVSTAVKRGEQVSETIVLKNAGALPARSVTAQLVGATSGATVPSWITLGSPAQLGDVAIGATTAIEIVATPRNDVADGIYRVAVLVGSANAGGGPIAVSVAVTDSQVGAVRFHVSNIYTDPNGILSQPPVLGLANASVQLQNEAVYTELRSARTDALGEVLIPNLPVGHYVYRVSAPNHADATGRILVRAVGNDTDNNGTPDTDPTLEEVFLDYEVVSFEWEVTETTIQDRYDVTLTATYQTNVPAPVVLIEPGSINLPDMQENEEFTGEVTVTNYGLLRADRVVFHPALSDSRLRIEYFGTVPDSLAAKQRVRLGYKITALETFPADAVQLMRDGGSASALFKASEQLLSGSCGAVQKPMSVGFEYECANGVSRNGSSQSGFNKAWGQCSPSGGGGGGGGPTGGPTTWPGGWGGPGGAPLGGPGGSGPGCTPECDACPCKGVGGTGGGGPGSDR